MKSLIPAHPRPKGVKPRAISILFAASAQISDLEDTQLGQQESSTIF